jgi:DNA polymerase-1
MELTNEEKKRLYSVLQNIKPLSNEERKQKTNSNILLIDGTNTFIRCWSVNPSMDENGYHTGGIVGSLKSIGYAIKLLAPTRCIIVFDGVGGSFKRRQLYPDYKKHRKTKIRLNRSYEEMSDVTTEEESCTKQYLRLSQYLQILPVNMLSIDHVEADDVIAYLATDYFKKSDKIYIMSSDKDFLQLCSNNVCVYSPTKKKIYGPAEVLDEYQIHPNNFVLLKALDGDDSDNINGIEGAGPKTIIKHFPWLNEEKQHTVDELISHATDLRNKYKVCENIAVGKTLLDRNVSLMQLKESALTTTAQLHCNECLDTSKIPRLQRGAFMNLVRDDMLSSNLPDHMGWLDKCFNQLDSVIR